MCPECGDFNFQKRSNKFDCSGKYALITGGRTKIGFHIAMSLLNNGANVIITTRFPKNCVSFFQREDNYDTFKDRLRCVCLDFKVP